MKKLASLLLLLSMMASMVACSSSSTTTTEASESSSVTTTEAVVEEIVTEVDQSKELIFAASRDQAPGENDSVYCTINLGVWQPLVTQDMDGNPTPSLALSWTSNEECTEWVFELRQDVTFSNGVPFDADIVLANFERYANGPYTSSFYGFNIDTVYPGLEDVIAVDEYTVQLNFSESYPMLPYAMTNFFSPMFEPSCFNEDGSFNGFAIGTGPYMFTENVLGEYCTLTRNDNYYGDLPAIENMRFRVIPDANTRYSALVSGEIHAVCDIGAITPSLAAGLEGDSDYVVSVGESGITHYFHVNGNEWPWSDARMREGLSLIFDREEINNEFYNGYSIPANGFLSYYSAFHNEQATLDYDFERGKALIDEVLQGQRVSAEFLLSEGDMSRYPHGEQAEYMQAILAQVGIDANITTLTWTAAKERLTAGDFDFCLKVQGLSSADPYSLFNAYMHSSGSTNISYGLGYSNPEVDAILESLSGEMDFEVRSEAYAYLQSFSAETVDFPTIPILFTCDVVACTSDLGGYVSAPYGIVGYTQLYWAN